MQLPDRSTIVMPDPNNVTVEPFLVTASYLSLLMVLVATTGDVTASRCALVL